MSTDPQIQFKLARADAIEAYAGVEQAFCSLFARLLGTKGDKAAVVFFRIGSARSRLIIIGDLLEKVHGNKYDTYFYGKKSKGNAVPGIFALLSQLDQKRNEIVHWHQPLAFKPPDYSRVQELSPPAEMWEDKGRADPVTIVSMKSFREKCLFVDKSVSALSASWGKHAAAMRDELAPWLEIFEQPVPYPPPSTHPIFQIGKEPRIPPQPSEA